ncbi:MAG: hypothetical protein V1776_00590 [Candidatus Diapherotrites archaeon]
MLHATYYKGRLCDSNLSYEFIPKEETRFPLKKTGNEIKENGHPLDILTEFVLVLRVQGISVSIYPSGKILVKNVPIETEAQTIFLATLKLLNECPSTLKI